LFTPPADNSVNESKEMQVKVRKDPPNPEKDSDDKKSNERELVFTGPFNRLDPPREEEEGEDGLFKDDDFDPVNEKYGDQTINDDGMMELRNTRERLQQQAKERKEQLKQARKHEMTKEEFNEKWSLPAYLRRGIKMNDVPHSSEPYISKYNLNDDNTLLGNNKFLHDNVD
jgi:cell division protein FtsZ